MVAALFLAVSAVGLNAAAQFLQLHFRKAPVPLPVKALTDEATGIPARLGPWMQASQDEPIDPEMEEALGTHQYLNRLYADTRINPSAAADFRALPKSERARRLAQIMSDHARNDRGAPQVPILTIGITYYTGLVDTVAHIPDRCYVADGYEPSSYELEQVPSNSFADGKARDLPFRFIAFEDQSGQGRVGRYVGYFFVVNGEYTADPLHVRYRLQNLLEKYGYYAKIELMAQSSDPQFVQSPECRRAVAKAMKEFIATGLPQIEGCLPDWQTVTTKGR